MVASLPVALACMHIYRPPANPPRPHLDSRSIMSEASLNPNRPRRVMYLQGRIRDAEVRLEL